MILEFLDLYPADNVLVSLSPQFVRRILFSFFEATPMAFGNMVRGTRVGPLSSGTRIYANATVSVFCSVGRCASSDDMGSS